MPLWPLLLPNTAASVHQLGSADVETVIGPHRCA